MRGWWVPNALLVIFRAEVSGVDVHGGGQVDRVHGRLALGFLWEVRHLPRLGHGGVVKVGEGHLDRPEHRHTPLGRVIDILCRARGRARGPKES